MDDTLKQTKQTGSVWRSGTQTLGLSRRMEDRLEIFSTDCRHRPRPAREIKFYGFWPLPSTWTRGEQDTV